MVLDDIIDPFDMTKYIPSRNTLDNVYSVWIFDLDKGDIQLWERGNRFCTELRQALTNILKPSNFALQTSITLHPPQPPVEGVLAPWVH